MTIANHITESVLERLANTPDPRLKEIMLSLVRHLHGFAREVKLTEAEWLKGIEFLTQTGHITNAQRQEFILLSDVLGLSMLTVAMNNDKPAGCTEATVFGPFHVEGAPHFKQGDDVANGAPGQPCTVRGQVRGLGGEAVANAEIDVWQADADGLYDVQRPDEGFGYPMSTLAVELDDPSLDREVAAALHDGSVVMSERSAALRDAFPDLAERAREVARTSRAWLDSRD